MSRILRSSDSGSSSSSRSFGLGLGLVLGLGACADPQPVDPATLARPYYIVYDERFGLCSDQRAVDGRGHAYRASGCEGDFTGLLPAGRPISAAERARIAVAFDALGTPDVPVPCDHSAPGFPEYITFEHGLDDDARTTHWWAACLPKQVPLPAPWTEAWAALDAAAR